MPIAKCRKEMLKTSNLIIAIACIDAAFKSIYGFVFAMDAYAKNL